LPLPDKPSIAVLPFANLSGDPEQEYFADGMVEEIITALSRIRWLFVIARNSSFTYKGKAVDVKQVRHDLGVRYVLEGSVRKGGNRVRITAQLIEAETGAHLWADRFDGSLEDVFELQDQVAISVAGVIEPALQAAEVRRSSVRPTSDLTAYDLYLRALANFPWFGKEQMAGAIELFEQAVAIDPGFAPALGWAAVCHTRFRLDGYAEDPETSRRKAKSHAERALARAGGDPGVLANVAMTLGDDENAEITSAIALIDQSLALNPSSARAWFISGLLRVLAGDCDEAIKHVETCLRLSPRDPVGVPYHRFRLFLQPPLRRGRGKARPFGAGLCRLALTLPHTRRVLCAYGKTGRRPRCDRPAPCGWPRDGYGNQSISPRGRPRAVVIRPTARWPTRRMTTTRRLAAILAADVAGYSRLMGTDEEGTHERLQTHLRELVNPKIGEHRGRIVKNTGHWRRLLGGVRERGGCRPLRTGDPARNGQARARRARRAPDQVSHRHQRRRRDRRGARHLRRRRQCCGAVGGIGRTRWRCISRMVWDQIRDKLPYPFEDMGVQQVKNIARPVRVYALRPEGTAGVRTPSVSSTVSRSPPVAAPRLSIVVLPFTNLSDDREQQYFADGITEDLATDLSRIPHMFVIARNTAFTYRDKPVGAKEIGRELEVRYVLEGSVRRSGNQIRVNAQLIDAETNAHLWAERLDRDVGDVLALQDEITRRIANALNIELIAAEAAKPTEHPDALDYILRGRAAKLKPESRDSFAEAINLFEHALALDPQSVEAQTHLAGSLAGLRVSMEQTTWSRPNSLARTP
jgi:TolB-like protein